MGQSVVQGQNMSSWKVWLNKTLPKIIIFGGREFFLSLTTTSAIMWQHTKKVTKMFKIPYILKIMYPKSELFCSICLFFFIKALKFRHLMFFSIISDWKAYFINVEGKFFKLDTWILLGSGSKHFIDRTFFFTPEFIFCCTSLPMWRQHWTLFTV